MLSQARLVALHQKREDNYLGTKTARQEDPLAPQMGPISMPSSIDSIRRVSSFRKRKWTCKRRNGEASRISYSAPRLPKKPRRWNGRKSSFSRLGMVVTKKPNFSKLQLMFLTTYQRMPSVEEGTKNWSSLRHAKTEHSIWSQKILLRSFKKKSLLILVLRLIKFLRCKRLVIRRILNCQRSSSLRFLPAWASSEISTQNNISMMTWWICAPQKPRKSWFSLLGIPKHWFLR